MQKENLVKIYSSNLLFLETTTFTVSSMIKETFSILAQANAPKKAVNTLISNVMENQWDLYILFSTRWWV